ncbi:hypothetical protein FEE59_10090 [Herbaspirillum sp. RU 5E]|nr:hypothetical protein [Herbaspirillum sp. RU 5E]
MKKFSMRLIFFAASMVSLSRSEVSAQALPSQSSMLSSALGQGITRNLISRGFAANDPRILTTIRAISAEVIPLAAGAGAGGTWLGAMAALAPYTLAAVAIGAGLYWYFDKDGNVYSAPPGSSVSSIASPGVQLGATLWLAPGYSVYFGTPQEALGYFFAQTISSSPNATFSTPSFKQVSASQYTATYTFTIPGSGISNVSATKSIYGYAQASVNKGGVTCPSGSGFSSSSGACVAVNFAGTPFAPVQVTGTSLSAAYGNLSAAVQSAPLSPELAAELANRLWKNASAQPNYPGLPIASSVPVSPDNFSDYQSSNPNLWPTTSSLSSSVPTSVDTAITLPSSSSNQNSSNPAAGNPQINLGADPGNPPPTLESAPTRVFEPIQKLLSGWTAWTVPSHSGVCPTWSISPAIAGHVFNIELKEQCVFAEQWRSSIAAVAMVAWLVVAAMIVLSA